MTEGQLHELVGIAIGSSSMCWDPIPSGVFKSECASTICDGILDAISTHYVSYDDLAECLGKDHMRHVADWVGNNANRRKSYFKK